MVRSISVCPNSVAAPPAHMVCDSFWKFRYLCRVEMHSITQFTMRSIYFIVTYLFAFGVTIISILWVR